MNYEGIIFGAIGIFALVSAYNDYDWFMNNRKARTVSTVLGGRDRARTFYICLGLIITTLGILNTFKVISLD